MTNVTREQPNERADAPRIVLPDRFDTRVIRPVQHTLAGHPLLTLSALRELASRLPTERLRWHRADIPVDSHFGNAAKEYPNGGSVLETLDTIESARSWVYLQHIEQDPLYAPVIAEAFRSVATQVEAVDPGAHQVCGWCFISSPRAVTPYHMDHETNFLLQIHGSKTISVWDPADRSVVSEQELELFHALWSLDHSRFRPEIEPRAVHVEAAPAGGVFMPYTAPHAVKTHHEYSITLSITFQTKRTQIEQKAFAIHHRLRRLGAHPGPVGVSAARDSLAAKCFDLYARSRELVRSLRGRGATQPSTAPY
jgi:Cupin-like domain